MPSSQPGSKVLQASPLFTGDRLLCDEPSTWFPPQTQDSCSRRWCPQHTSYHVAVAGLHLGLRGREGQSLSVHEVKKRVTGCDQDVDSHAKLKIEDGVEALGLCNNTVVPQHLWGFESRNFFLNQGFEPLHGYQTPRVFQAPV